MAQTTAFDSQTNNFKTRNTQSSGLRLQIDPLSPHRVFKTSQPPNENVPRLPITYSIYDQQTHGKPCVYPIYSCVSSFLLQVQKQHFLYISLISYFFHFYFFPFFPSFNSTSVFNNQCSFKLSTLHSCFNGGARITVFWSPSGGVWLVFPSMGTEFYEGVLVVPSMGTMS